MITLNGLGSATSEYAGSRRSGFIIRVGRVRKRIRQQKIHFCVTLSHKLRLERAYPASKIRLLGVTSERFKKVKKTNANDDLDSQGSRVDTPRGSR